MIQPLSSRRCCVGPLLLALLLLLLLPMIISAWVSLPTSNTFSTMQRSCATNTMAATTRWRVFGRTAIAATETDDFASFAATLEQDAVKQQQQQRPASSSTTRTTWQEDLERVLDPTTSNAQRQILVSDLLQSTEKTADIRASVQTALRDRKIDSLLTPTGRKLQDGTRAVARQLTNDILPSLVANRRSSSSTSTLESSSPLSPFPLPLPPLPRPEEVSRVGNRVWSAVSNQMQRNLETLQADLANPSRIPERIAKQNKDLLVEAGNIFSEKPAGLREPKYTVVSTYVDYEIRDYQTYTVATTNIGELKTASTMASASDEQPFAADQGVAFNTLASYIFGANADQRPMEMTTPVTTTASGEMRFFVPDSAPDPLAQDATQSAYEQSKIRIERIPAARLAVRRFTGFCTAGEIARQKEALLAAIALDGDQVELDVPHGQTVGHVVFQYNPPYTLPVIRCNEIAVPVMVPSDEEELVGNSWELTATNGLSA